MKPGTWPLLIVLAFVGALAIRRVGPEVLFYDEGVYVATAWSLASGSGYRNPILPDTPPQAKYPPAVPLVFAAIWHVLPRFSDSLVVMKGMVLASGIGTVALSWAYLRWVVALGPFDALLAAAVLGVAPFFLIFSTLATSDIPYVFFTLAALLLYERSRSGADGIRFGAALIVAALAFLTRTTALFLFTAFFLDLLRERRGRRAAACAVVSAVVAIPWLLWSQWASALYAHYPPEVRSNYVGYASAISSTSWISDSAKVVAYNLRLFLSTWGVFVVPWLSAQMASLVVLAALAAAVLRRRRPPLNACTLYCALYVASIIIVPYPDTRRYALAVMPFLIAVFVAGVRALIPSRLIATAAVLALAISAVFVNGRAAWRLGGGWNEALFEDFHRTTEWIAAQTPADAVLVGDYDPGYFLYAGRRSIRLSVNDNFRVYYTDQVSKDFPEAPALAASFQQMRACYFVRDPMIGGPEGEWFGGLLDAVQAAAPAPFAIAYTSPRGLFTVYRRTDCPSS